MPFHKVTVQWKTPNKDKFILTWGKPVCLNAESNKYQFSLSIIWTIVDPIWITEKKWKEITMMSKYLQIFMTFTVYSLLLTHTMLLISTAFTSKTSLKNVISGSRYRYDNPAVTVWTFVKKLFISKGRRAGCLILSMQTLVKRPSTSKRGDFLIF